MFGFPGCDNRILSQCCDREREANFNWIRAAEPLREQPVKDIGDAEVLIRTYTVNGSGFQHLIVQPLLTALGVLYGVFPLGQWRCGAAQAGSPRRQFFPTRQCLRCSS